MRGLRERRRASNRGQGLSRTELNRKTGRDKPCPYFLLVIGSVPPLNGSRNRPLLKAESIEPMSVRLLAPPRELPLGVVPSIQLHLLDRRFDRPPVQPDTHTTRR
jgi:hypothetical protein